MATGGDAGLRASVAILRMRGAQTNPEWEHDGGMAQGHYGLVSTGRGERRVSSGAGCSTPSLPCANSNAVVSGLREGAVSSKRDNLLLDQGSGRGTRHGDALSGVLQSDLLGAQERWHIQASIRLKVHERLRSQG